MFNRLIASLERIQYQQKSPLFKELTELYQKCIDTLNNDNVFLAASGYKLQNRVYKVLEKLQFFSELKKIILKNTNHTITDVYLYESSVGNAAIGCGFSLDKESVLYNHPLYYELAAAHTVPEDYHDLVEVLTNQTDNKNGKIREIVGKYYSAVLYISTGLFTVDRFYGNIEKLTAGECAAITLHEIGHSVTFIESFCLAVEKASKIRSFIESTNKKLNKSNIKEFQKLLKAESKKITNPVERENILIILNRLSEQKSFSEDQTMAIYITTMVALAFAGTFYMDDLITTDLNESHFERITDEFATQHGAAAEQASGLTKLYSTEEAGMGHIVTKLTRNSTIINSIVVSMQVFKNILIYPLMCAVKSYDPLVRRLKLLAQNTTEELKDATIPKELRDELLESVRKAREVISEYESRNYVKIREAFWNSIFSICKPIGMLNVLGNTGLASDYQKLQEITKDLVQSPMSYHAARLQALKERKEP